MSTQGAHPQITVSAAPGVGEQLAARFGSPDHETVFHLIRKISDAHNRGRSSPATAYPLFDAGECTIQTGSDCIRVPWARFIHDAWLSERPDIKDTLKEEFLNVDAVPPSGESRTTVIESCTEAVAASLRPADLLREIAETGIGRPSTYSDILVSLLKHGMEIDSSGGCQLTAKGEEVLRCIEQSEKNGTVVLDEAFVAHLDAQLDMIATGKANAADVANAVLGDLCAAKADFGWIEGLGFAGETFEQHAARSAEARKSPDTLRSMSGIPAYLDPEQVVPKDSPLRKCRAALEQQLAETVRGWTELSPMSQSAYRLVAIAGDRQVNCQLLLSRSRFDLLLRWIAGLPTAGPEPSAQLVTDAVSRWSVSKWSKLDWPSELKLQ